jgi:deoxyribonuclease IV
MNNYKRPVGLHVRLEKGFLDIVQAIEKFKVPIIQSFLLNEDGKYVSCSSKIQQEFIHAKKEYGFRYFVHAAYWSSLTNVKSNEFLSLVKETGIAADLTSDGIVIHVGATQAGISKQDQAQYVAQGLNELLLQIPEIPVLLENGPHGGRNFGGDFTDFMLLHNLVEQKHRVQYCVDTAHAYVYGYNLKNPVDLKKFFQLLQEVFKDQTVALLHLNDTEHECASQIDKHGVLGEGLLGSTVLKECMQYPLLKEVPIVLELPNSCDDLKISSILKIVHSFDE